MQSIGNILRIFSDKICVSYVTHVDSESEVVS